MSRKGSVLFVLLWTVLIFAVPPRILNYQGKLTDTSGVALTGSHDIVFRIYDVPTGGTPLWEEAHTSASGHPVNVVNGLFDVHLGEITPLIIAFDDTYWIELEIDGEVLSPREMYAAVPYAFRAIVADTAYVVGSGAVQTDGTSITGDGTTASPLSVADGGITTTKLADGAVTSAKLDDMGASSGQVLKWNGTNWAPAQDSVDDADNVIGNEYNTSLSFDDGSNTLSLTDGGGTLTTTINNEADNLTDNVLNDLGDVDAGSPSAGQVLTWDGSAWVPGDVSTTDNYADGVSFNDATNTLTITRTGGLSDLTTTIDNEADDLSDNSIGDLGDVNTSGVVAGQVLKWDGTAWAPADDDNTTYRPGEGLSLSDDVFSVNVDSVTIGINDSNQLYIADVPAGDGDYIWRQDTAAQTGSFWISGSAILQDTLAIVSTTDGDGDRIILGSSVSGTGSRAQISLLENRGYNEIRINAYDSTWGNFIFTGNPNAGTGQGLFIAGGSHVAPFPVFSVNADTTYFGYCIDGKGNVRTGGDADGILFVRGKVGIGDTVANSELDVSGTIRAQHYRDSNGDVLLRSSDGSVNITEDADGSWNLTVVGGGGGGVGGSGTVNYLAKWTPDGSTLGNSIVYDDGTNAGIGTTSPAAKLEVNQTVNSSAALFTHMYAEADSIWIAKDRANIVIKGHDGDAGLEINCYDDTYGNLIYSRDYTDGTGQDIAIMGTTTDGPFDYFTVASNYTMIGYGHRGASSSAAGNLLVKGNVGVGTTSPSYTLDVNGTGRIGGAFYLGTVPDDAVHDSVLTISGGQVMKVATSDISSTVSPGGPDGAVQYNNSGAFAGDSALTWRESDSTLVINTASVSDGIELIGNTWGCPAIILRTVNDYGSAELAFSNSMSYNPAGIEFEKGSSSSTTNILTIFNNYHNLESSSLGDIRFEVDGGDVSMLIHGDHSAVDFLVPPRVLSSRMFISGYDGSGNFWVTTGGTEPNSCFLNLISSDSVNADGVNIAPRGGTGLVVNSSKQVGIKVSTPSYDLQLANDSAAKPGTNTWTVISDGRLKTDITPYTAGLEDVLKISPVWFRYNGKAGMPTDKKFVGVIAQDLQKVAPYMVDRWNYVSPDGDTATYLAVNNGAMTYMLINAVKELAARVQKLEQENTRLKERVEQLEKSSR